MNTISQDTPLGEALAGMVLAADLLDDSGGMLLPAGATLSESSLNSLRRRGVEMVSVVSEAKPVDSAVLQALREQRRQRLQVLFRRSAAVGATPVLLAILDSYRSGQAS